MRKWIATLGGAGLSPIAPGTAGSLLTAALLLGIYEIFLPGVWAWTAVLVGGTLVFGGVCVAMGPWAAAHFGRKDPGGMVLDEAAGMCLTMVGLPVYAGWREAIAIAAGLVAFRLLDIVKPPPARQLERIDGGWGILLDDLAAAVYANILCQGALRLIVKMT